MSQHTLDQRLVEFRRKYYTDKVLRGSLISALLLTSMIFVALAGEGLLGFSSAVRTAIVYGLGAVALGVLGYWVIYPLTKLFNLTRTISDFDIAEMVRQRFPNINDKLINVLQLRREAASNALVTAAIEQKSSEIVPVEIDSAIDLRVNLRYLRWLLIPLLLFLLVWAIFPGFLRTSTARLVNYDQEFLPPPPFQIELGNLPDRMVAGSSLQLNVKVDGNELPAELSVFIRKASEDGFLDYTLEKKSPTEFTYTLSDLKETFALYVGNPEVKSAMRTIEVLKRPFIRNFKLRVTYPAYTGLGEEILEDNIGDFKAIKGSTVSWVVESQGEIKDARMIINGTGLPLRATDKGYALSYRLMQDMEYFISLNSVHNLGNADTVKYKATMLADRFPSVYVISPSETHIVDVDPTLPLDVEFSDDFGFTKASLFYRISKSGGTSAVTPDYKEFPLELDKRMLLQPISKMVDLSQLGLREGDELEYFVRVWDNDGVSGAKASTSGTFKVIHPTLDAKYDEMQEQQEEVKDKLENVEKRADELKEQYQKMQQKMLEQKKLSFDDRKEMQQMLKNHNQMLQELKEAQKEFEKNKNDLQQNQMISEETLQKYEQLNEYLKQLNNPEIEKMLKEFQEKLEQINPEEVRQKMEQLKMNEEDVKRSIERTMELLKQLEVSQKVDELRNKLENLKAKQDLLNEQLEKAKTPEEMKNISDRQDDLNQQMEKLQEDLEKLGEMKKETSTPDEKQMEEIKKLGDEARKEMENAEDKSDSAADQQQQSEEQQKQGDNKDAKQSAQQAQQSKQSASKSQKSASQRMMQMEQQLSSMQMQSQNQQDEQNLESLRELLENLLKLSFDQEDLRDAVKVLKYGDPVLKDKGQQQKKLQDDMGLVRDSLQSLANKVFQIQKFVLDESAKITDNMDKSQLYFRNKQIPMITYHQQNSMTSINNLANMLSQVMQQMQEQMKNAKPGGGMCQKPGKKPQGKQPGLSQQQQQLNQQMQQMLNGKNMDPNALQQMAAQQEAIRKQLKEAHDKVRQEGGQTLGDVGKMMEDMEKTEQELIRKQLTEETLTRQQEILSRLLQSERAVRERDWDEQRESHTGKVADRKSPEELSKEELRSRIRQEMLKTSKLEYSPDFIRLIETYYKRLEGQQ